MLHANVVEGVHRIEDAYTNWYLIEQDGRLTIVDAGVPTSWESLHDALGRLGHRASDVEAVVLTRTFRSCGVRGGRRAPSSASRSTSTRTTCR